MHATKANYMLINTESFMLFMVYGCRISEDGHYVDWQLLVRLWTVSLLLQNPRGEERKRLAVSLLVPARWFVFFPRVSSSKRAWLHDCDLNCCSLVAENVISGQKARQQVPSFSPSLSFQAVWRYASWCTDKPSPREEGTNVTFVYKRYIVLQTRFYLNVLW